MPWTSYGSAGGTYGDVTSGYGGGPDPYDGNGRIDPGGDDIIDI